MVIVHPNTEFYKPIHSGRRFSIKMGYYMDETLKTNIDDYLVPAVKKKWDAVMLVTGIEGSGKSTFAAALAYYVDPTFCLARLCFTPDELIEAIDNSRPGEAIVFDEAVMGMFAQDAGTSVQNVLIKKFVTIRKKRLFIFIVIPSIFLLRKYFAIFRTRALIHCYTPDGISRGFFKLYSFGTKRKLYIKGSREFDQGSQKPDFTGGFTNTEGYFFDLKEYDDKKEEAIKSLTLKSQKKKKLTKTQQRMINERHLFLMLAFKLFKYHAEWKKRFSKKEAHLKPSAPGFSKFVKEKLKYKIGYQAIRSAVEEAGKIMDEMEAEKKKKEELAAKVKID